MDVDYDNFKKGKNVHKLHDYSCCMLSFGWFLSVWNLHADISEHSVCSIFIDRWVRVEPTCLWRWNRQSVLKRRHINFRRRGITQKKAYNIQYMVKVWNHVYSCSENTDNADCACKPCEKPILYQILE